MPRRFAPYRVAVCGLDELAGFTDAAVSHVVSILDPDHPEPADFAAYGAHRRLELRFHDIIDETAGQIAPGVDDINRILAFGAALSGPEAASHLLVHCHAGISRSTAALTMILAQANPAAAATDIVAAVASIRSKTWPNLRMIEIADAVLGRGGELTAAVQDRHHRYGTERPEVLTYLLNSGRQRELFWLE